MTRATRKLCRRVHERTREDNGYISEKDERGFSGAVTLQLNLEDWLVLGNCGHEGKGWGQKNKKKNIKGHAHASLVANSVIVYQNIHDLSL